MGLLSFMKNSKQDEADIGHRDDDAFAAAARSKRPSNAGKAKGADPLLPEKKRARRRLVGAFALALAAAVGLPMILDSEPKPLATDIDIKIPSKDKAAPLPAASVAAASAALDPKEEIVEPPKTVAAEPKPVDPPPVAKVDTKPEPKPEAKPETVKPVEAPKPEPKKPEPKVAEVKDAKPAVKAPEPKPVDAKTTKAADDARALAILEGKAADKPAAAEGQKFVVQVGAFRSEKVGEVQDKLKAAGIASFTQKIPGNDLTRVRVGPFPNREEADKAHAKIKALGLGGSVMGA